jgi:hypothetical protein
VAVAGLQALIAALAMAAVALLAAGAVFRPLQTITVLATLGAWALLLANPVAFIIILALGLALGWHRDQPP